MGEAIRATTCILDLSRGQTFRLEELDLLREICALRLDTGKSGTAE